MRPQPSRSTGYEPGELPLLNIPARTTNSQVKLLQEAKILLREVKFPKTQVQDTFLIW